MKIFYVSFGVFVLIIVFLVFLSNRNELENMPIQGVFFEKGEKLSDAAKAFEVAIQDSGHDWHVLVDPKISSRKADVNFGGTGDARNLAYVISITYNSKPVIFKKNKLILFIDAS